VCLHHHERIDGTGYPFGLAQEQISLLARMGTVCDVYDCALMIALARQLELSDPLVHEAGLAGLLHDIGKMAVPDPILNKPGKLTEQEFGLVRRHPQNGARMLLDCRQVSALVVDVCLHHHERIDGTGYPFGLAQEQISLLARMGTV
ncbi:HD-GYP domain-containing protein, partial [Klebsiella pneumoniae subsp. pneumoniae]